MPIRRTARVQIGIETLEDRLALSTSTPAPVPWPAPPTSSTPTAALRVTRSSSPQRQTGRNSSNRSGSNRAVRDVVVSTTTGSTSSVASGPTSSQIPQLGSMASDILKLVNAERSRLGLAPLTFDSRLMTASSLQAKNMVQRSNTNGPTAALQHTLTGMAQPTLTSRLSFAGYAYRYAGENIAYGYPSAVAVVNAWMQSAGHRANIQSANFTQTGIAIHKDAAGRLFFCQVFGSQG